MKTAAKNPALNYLKKTAFVYACVDSKGNILSRHRTERVARRYAGYHRTGLAAQHYGVEIEDVEIAELVA